jgi:hypothetical protein
MKNILSGALILGVAVLAGSAAGQGPRMDRGPMMGGMAGEGHEDMMAIHALFADHEKIDRRVTKVPNGVETITESDDPAVAKRILEHAYAMKARLERKQPIRMWDPLFRELFLHADKIRMEITGTVRGAKVLETSDDAYAVKLIQAHADAVSGFVDKGMAAMHESHDVPAR